MPNQKQPIDLIAYKGRKHLTKNEIRERASSEVDAPADNIEIPKFLNAKQKQEYIRLAEELLRVGIMDGGDVLYGNSALAPAALLAQGLALKKGGGISGKNS